jgi:hypothetical protein
MNDQFYYPGPSKAQTAIFNLLHVKRNIPITTIIECIDEYVSRHPGLQGNRSCSEVKYYSKPKHALELKKSILGCISYTDPWANNFGEFLEIVTNKTGQVFKTTKYAKTL